MFQIESCGADKKSCDGGKIWDVHHCSALSASISKSEDVSSPSPLVKLKFTFSSRLFIVSMISSVLRSRLSILALSALSREHHP